MNRKQIIILIVVFLSVILISAVSVYLIRSDNHNRVLKVNNGLKVGEYTLNYGVYKGIEKEYNADTDTIEDKEITLVLSKNKVNDAFYQVKGMSLYVNNYEMYKVVANNKIKLLAGEGVDFEYEGK